MLKNILADILTLTIRAVILGTLGHVFWNLKWHQWFNAPPITWSQAIGAVLIINVAAFDFRNSRPKP